MTFSINVLEFKVRYFHLNGGFSSMKGKENVFYMTPVNVLSVLTENI